MSLKRVHTGYENNETYHDSQKIKIVIISDPIAAPGASSETQGQSVGSGEKAERRFSSTGKRAPGYRLSPNYFQKFKQIPPPDWAQKCFVLLCPIGEQFLLSSFREFVHDGYCLATLARFVDQACACEESFYFLVS